MSWLDNRNNAAQRESAALSAVSITANPVITIAGERQTGKTEMIIDRMVRHAQDGMRVAYVGPTMACARETQSRAESRGGKSRRRNGEERIDYASGGSILFLSAGSLRGLVLDALVWDDVQKPISEDAYIASKLIYHITAE